MKKLKIPFVLVFLFIFLLGCTKNNANTDESDSNIELENGDSEFILAEEELSLGEFTILEGEFSNVAEQAGALTIEEAAAIGGAYILDIFNDDLDGMYMELTFDYNHQISHSTWNGRIARTATEFNPKYDLTAGEFPPLLLTFMIDAFTGERLGISNVEDDSLTPFSFEMNEGELLELFPEPGEEEVEQLTAIAYEYAERHFGRGMVFNIELNSVDSIYNPSPYLSFIAIDNEDRVIEVSIRRETLELELIFTPMNLLL